MLAINLGYDCRMSQEIVVLSKQEFSEIIRAERIEAYAAGYIKAKQEQEAVKAEPKFNEILRGVKELRMYLEYKGYWRGSINTLNKVAPQLLADGDRKGHGLIFRCTYIDHAFQNEFRFAQPEKKPKPQKTASCS